MKVISQKSEETKCKLYGVPPLEDYEWGFFPPELSLFKNVHEINASMALQISRYFLTRSLLLPTKISLKKKFRETSNLSAMAPGFKIDAEQALGYQSFTSLMADLRQDINRQSFLIYQVP